MGDVSMSYMRRQGLKKRALFCTSVTFFSSGNRLYYWISLIVFNSLIVYKIAFVKGKVQYFGKITNVTTTTTCLYY